jgi:hypothetical protein
MDRVSRLLASAREELKTLQQRSDALETEAAKSGMELENHVNQMIELKVQLAENDLAIQKAKHDSLHSHGKVNIVEVWAQANAAALGHLEQLERRARQQEHEARDKELADRHATALARLKLHEQQGDQLSSYHAQVLAEVEDSLNSAFEKNLADAASKHAEQLAGVQARHDAELAAAKEALDLARHLAAAATEALRERDAAFASSLSKSQHEIEEQLTRRHQIEIAAKDSELAMRAAAEARLSELLAAAQARVEVLETTASTNAAELGSHIESLIKLKSKLREQC